LQELRDSSLLIDGQRRRVLDEVDAISSVSGGSFTSAYYGLHGDQIFEDFEEVFLKRDVQSQLLHGVLNPLRWFGRTGRTEMAIGMYERQIFHDQTFADLQAGGGPLILINASDLGYGVRFTFLQEYFNLLCSDLNSYPVARAVTASSAVPVLFNPVVVKNYPGCEAERARFMEVVSKAATDNPEIDEVVTGLSTFQDVDKRKYAHFVDGGITDNLGLRAIYELIEVAGGAKAFLKIHGREPPSRIVVISVDASTSPEPVMDETAKQPTLEETIDAMSTAQLHLYNAATLELMDRSLRKWTDEISTPQRPVKPYFIKIGFNDIKEPDRQRYFNSIPTSFRLSEEQVDSLIAAGRELLRNDPVFHRMLADVQAGPVARR
jgi:NTE family protein